MSEQRFKLIKPLGTRLGLKDIFIKDIVNDYYYNEKEQVVDLLNEQQDKITELEKDFENLVNWSTEIAKRNVLLDEKIGRLQQENNELKNKLNKHL